MKRAWGKYILMKNLPLCSIELFYNLECNNNVMLLLLPFSVIYILKLVVKTTRLCDNLKLRSCGIKGSDIANFMGMKSLCAQVLH